MWSHIITLSTTALQWMKQNINQELNLSKKNTPYLALTGVLHAVYCEELGKNWRYNGTALYCYWNGTRRCDIFQSIHSYYIWDFHIFLMVSLLRTLTDGRISCGIFFHQSSWLHVVTKTWIPDNRQNRQHAGTRMWNMISSPATPTVCLEQKSENFQSRNVTLSMPSQSKK